jgi:hypothetical protein
MPIEVISPVTRKGSKVGSSIHRAESPGARSAPGRSDQAEPPEQQQRPLRATVRSRRAR